MRSLVQSLGELGFSQTVFFAVEDNCLVQCIVKSILRLFKHNQRRPSGIPEKLICYITNKNFFLEECKMYSPWSTHFISISNSNWIKYNILHPYMFLYALRHKTTVSALIYIWLAFPERFTQSYICVSFSNNKYKKYDWTTKIIRKLHYSFWSSFGRGLKFWF